MTIGLRYLLADFLRWLANRVDPEHGDWKVGGTDPDDD